VSSPSYNGTCCSEGGCKNSINDDVRSHLVLEGLV
jgi:hypothetical protein